MKNKFSIIISAYILFFVGIVVVGYNIVNKRNQDKEIKTESQSKVQSEIESMSLLSSSERELEDWEKEAIKEQEEYEKWLKDMNEKYDFEYSRGGNGWLVVCYELAKKNGDWSRIPLTENFKKKYNEKDGILGDITYDKIEYMPYSGTDSDFTFKEYYTYFVIYQGKKQVAYFFNPQYDEDGWIDDVAFYDIIETYDENGKKFEEEKVGIDSNTWTYCFYNLARGGDAERQVGVTDRFRKKYPLFLDLFERYSPHRFNKIKFQEEKSSFEKKEVYFIVDSELEWKKREYRVNFQLTDNGYLDDVDVICVREEKLKSGSYDEGNMIFYKKSNWEVLKLGKPFLRRYKPESGTFPEIDSIDKNFAFRRDNGEYDQISLESSEKHIIQIQKFRIKGKYSFYLYIVYLNRDILDNLIYKKLPYENMTLEEAKEKYIKECPNLLDGLNKY